MDTFDNATVPVTLTSPVTCDILIRSYYKDFAWLRQALHSVRRYCHSFSKIVVIVPQSSRAKLNWMGLSGDVTWSCPDYRDDYLGQQVTKLTADQFCEADYICHIDSDCIFHCNTTPNDLFRHGKPHIYMTQYEHLDPHTPWKSITERFLGRTVDLEFMRTPPYVFPRWIYGALRDYAQIRHGQSLEEYILQQPARGFSEFNALGAYAFHHHHEHFTWSEIGPDSLLQSPCRVYWSWGGMDEATLKEITALLQ